VIGNLRVLRGYVLLPLVAIAVTFLVVTPLVLMANADPFAALYSFVVEPFTSRISAVELLVKTAPLALTGVSVAIAFSAGYYNIGAEGQLLAGAVFAAWLGPLLKDAPGVVAIPLMLMGGAAAGALWALVPALLKTRRNVDEVVTTLLLNYVMLFLVTGLLNGPWRNPVTQMPQSPSIAPAAEFPVLLTNSRLHLGFIVALLALIGYGFLMWRTSFGLKMRAVGMGKVSARFLGVNIARVTLTAALLSGAVAGLAGVGEVGGVHRRLIEDVAGGYGYAGIIVATMGGLHPVGIALSAFFLALIENGAQEASRSLGVPIYLANVVQATLLLVTLVIIYFRRRMNR
jgi:simple sugar transport system permease protein